MIFFAIKGEKFVTFEEFLPIFSQVKKDKDVGAFEDLVEGLKVYDKLENGCMLGAELAHVLLFLGTCGLTCFLCLPPLPYFFRRFRLLWKKRQLPSFFLTLRVFSALQPPAHTHTHKDKSIHKKCIHFFRPCLAVSQTLSSHTHLRMQFDWQSLVILVLFSKPTKKFGQFFWISLIYFTKKAKK